MTDKDGHQIWTPLERLFTIFLGSFLIYRENFAAVLLQKNFQKEEARNNIWKYMFPYEIW